MTIPRSKTNTLKKALNSFLEEEEDPYVFGGDTTKKKHKTITSQKKIGLKKFNYSLEFL